MRIGIDARFWGPIGKGLGRYTQKLIENLEKIDRENQYFIFLRKENFDDFVSVGENFKKVLADYHWYSWEEQIKFPRLLRSYDLDLVHFPHFNIPIFYRGKFVVTIHDLILLHFPTVRNTTLNPLFYKIKFFCYRKVIRTALRKSERIITVSKFTQKDILSEFPLISKEKIAVTYEATENFCFLSLSEAEKVLKKYGIMKPYLLYVGNAYPHKNLERLALAFQKVRNFFPEMRLVLVGKKDYFYRRLESFITERKIAGVVLAGFVSDEELDLVFKEARLYVWPSLYEGFGLPPLEAMAKGTPVVSSREACMPETLGEAVGYFDGKKVEDMANVIGDILGQEEKRQDLIHRGYEQVKKYSWKKMGEETLAIYKDIFRKVS
ncbi:MAG: glycosyltransferase family 4 protein [Patescibacteria group bacterium]